MDIEDLLDENKTLVQALLDVIDNATKTINKTVKTLASSLDTKNMAVEDDSTEGEVENNILGNETFEAKGFDTSKIDAGGWDEANIDSYP